MKEKKISKIISLLKTKEKYVSNDDELLKAKVYTDIMNMDKELIELLISDDEIKESFFVDIEGTLVFDKKKFAWVVDSKEFLPDSYTSYTNKIGLTSDGDFISNKNDVVLDFPYKDCILEGGQDKDDQKRKEIFYNETLASSEIRRMLDPKVFTKAKRYTKDGLEEDISFNEDDNLIIKGNNLIALTSLLKRYEGKVKCIYIDPPYNTGNDSFNYNDSFNHSTWITFMKNRLEISYKLLSNDGSIWINIDDDEAHYLKILCDEIFGRESFVCNIIWEKKHTRSNDARYFSDNHDHIIVYAKEKSIWKINKLPRTEDMNSSYTNPDNDPRGSWQSMPLHAKSGSKSTSSDNFEYKFKNGVLWSPPPGTYSRFSRQRLKEMDDENMIWFGAKGTNIPRYKKYLSGLTDGVVPKTIWTHREVGHNQDSKKEVADLLGAGKFDTPKPEKLLQRILHISSSDNDLILDFFTGSATTQAVAHKMGRRYIGVEQMDYVEDITVERLKKVIDGEQGGISKATNWQGGGSFVYCELKENANDLIREIENADENTIKDVKAKIYKDERIIPYIITEDLEKVDEDFEDLDLKDKKKALIKLVDKNKLYVNYSDIDNADFKISEADKKFTNSFYEVD